MGYVYNSVSEGYISKTLDKSLKEYLYVPCYNLSTILGDNNGKINLTTVKQIISGMSITSPGIVLLGELNDILEHQEDDSILPPESYINEFLS